MKRYGPSTGGSWKAMLRRILTPSKVTKIEDLSTEVEGWEETYLETRLGARIKNFSLASGDGPMDIGQFGKKGKGKGKLSTGKGKEGKGKGKKGKGGSNQTANGKVDHMAKERWSFGGGAANKNQLPKKGEKGGSKGGKGR